MFCENCGKELKEDDLFCWNCGKSINISSIKDKEDEKLLEHDKEIPLEHDKDIEHIKGTSKFKPVVAFILVILAGASLIYLLSTNKNDTPYTQPTDSNSIPTPATVSQTEIVNPTDTQTINPTYTSVQSNGPSETLQVGETWNVGSGYSLTASSIDAKTNPGQVWLTLVKDGVKKDDKVLNAGDVYTFMVRPNNKIIFSAKIANIFSGQGSDMVTITDVQINQ